ncbi:MAG: hypothetical protein BECKG1743D_GA0114223_102311, partial [Candidatus Kentron sp. G]
PIAPCTDHNRSATSKTRISKQLLRHPTENNRLYRKCSGGLFRSIGCDPPRWVSNNDYSVNIVIKRIKDVTFAVPVLLRP